MPVAFLFLDAGSSPGQALLNTKQNKISQGRLVKSGMTECIVIPAQAGIQCNSGSTLPITHHCSSTSGCPRIKYGAGLSSPA